MINFQFSSRLCSLILAISLSCIYVFAQNNPNLKNDAAPPDYDAPPPNEEEFQKSDGIVLPSRTINCNALTRESRKVICVGKEWACKGVVTLYNENGTLWYRFNNHHIKLSECEGGDLEHFSHGNSVGLLPLAAFFVDAAILRLVRESEHWYEVEVNIETKATKFVLKSDSQWAKKDWSYFLVELMYFNLIEEQPLRDKSNGKIIEETVGLKFPALKFRKVENDWAFVEGQMKGEKKVYQGWIQWRKGEELLITDNNRWIYFLKPEDKKYLFIK